MSVNYFDSHDFNNDGNADFAYVSQGLAGESEPGLTYGMATGSRRIVLGTTTWLYTYVFYDKRGRVIQVRSDNHLSPTKEDLVTQVFDFEGKVLTRKTFHKAGAGMETTIINSYEYDPSGRLVKVFQQNNSDASQLVAKYEYNELGQLVDKKLHHTGGEDYLQSVDYRYTIKGQLASINNAKLSDDGDQNDDAMIILVSNYYTTARRAALITRPILTATFPP